MKKNIKNLKLLTPAGLLHAEHKNANISIEELHVVMTILGGKSCADYVSRMVNRASAASVDVVYALGGPCIVFPS